MDYKSTSTAQKSQLRELLTCPVCQDIFVDPHQLPCGHSLCMQCLNDMLRHRLLVQPFSCPSCRACFGPLIGVHKSYTLHNIVEDFNATSQQEEQKDQREQFTQTDPVIVDEPADYVNYNSILFLLLCLTSIATYCAFMFSMQNLTLTETVQRQRNLLLMYSPDISDLTLNKDTAGPTLMLSEDLLTVRRVKEEQHYPDNPARFAAEPQVLSRECVFGGNHYWELEAQGYWDIAVAYKSISRISSFGLNEDSWTLTHDSKGRLFAYHEGKKVKILKSLTHDRVGVVVDFEEGIITFHEVGAVWNHLHTFKAKLTQPVCLGLGLYRADLNTRISVRKTLS